jgi:hypothetical protein
VERDARDDAQAQHPATPTDEPKRQWRTPEIVDVGDVSDLTEGIGGNLNDGSAGSMMVTYWK